MVVSCGRCPQVLDAMGNDDAVEELFKTDPLQEGLAWPPLALYENQLLYDFDVLS